MDLVQLRPPWPEDEAEFDAAHETMARESFAFGIGYEPTLDFSTYLAGLELLAGATEPIDGFVPGALLLGDVGGSIIGRISIRFMLNDFLASEGGHIGYCVLPPYRRRGYAVDMLRQGVGILRERGVERILITCDDDNVGSASVIKRCGGVYESTVPSSRGGRPKQRFWIE